MSVQSPEQVRPIKQRLAEILLGANAISYYCSLLIHFVALGVTVLVLWSLDALLIVEIFEQRFAVEAALADEDIDDDVPKFEKVADIEIQTAGGRLVQSNLASNAAFSPLGSEMAPSEISSLAGLGDGIGDEEGDGVGFKFKMPKDGQAVTKGSFTAWTVPQKPLEGQPYRIVIEVRLPKRVRVYRSSDLSGKVVGTDGYTQFVPFDRNKPTATYTTKGDDVEIIRMSSKLPLHNHIAQIVVRVPGAARLVRDTIVIRSRRLKEEQTLQLVFKAPDSGE